MNHTQLNWLIQVSEKIPALFRSIEEGKNSASTELGVRILGGRTVQLLLKVEVVDPGENPMASHASVNFPTAAQDLPDIPTIKPRHRKRPKRW